MTVLSDRGAPAPAAWTRLRAPQSRMAPAEPAVLAENVQTSSLHGKYAEQVDRESAYERLATRLQKAPVEETPGSADPDRPGRSRSTRTRAPRWEKSTAEKVIESSAFKQLARSAAAVVGREIARSVFGTRRR